MSYYQKYLDNYSRGYIGFNTLSILFQSCLGSIAAMLVLQNGATPVQMIQLFLVTIFCMCFNGAVLSQQKPKTVFNMLIATVFVSIAISLINIFII